MIIKAEKSKPAKPASRRHIISEPPRRAAPLSRREQLIHIKIAIILGLGVERGHYAFADEIMLLYARAPRTISVFKKTIARSGSG